ncbi:MAG: DUF6263 family protein [Pirellulales bacterium]
MRSIGTITRLGLACLFAFIMLARGAAAQEPLRWKFEKGEKLDYKMVQDMTMTAEGGPLKKMETKMRQEMDMTWDIEDVNAEGHAVIRQKFDRVKMKMTTPVGGFEYDSDSDEAPAGLAAMIAPMYKAMTEGEFIITMSDRGEVKDVKIPEEVLTALKNSPGAAAMGDLSTAEGFKKMISQGALVLPEAQPKEGETWSTKVEMNNPMVGTQTVQTTYRYEGDKEMDGTTYSVIRPELKMDFANNAQPNLQMKIGEQSSDGEVLFNVDEGRLHTSTLNQNLTLDITVGGQPMKQKIDQKINVTVTRAGEAESDQPSAESEEAKVESEEAKVESEEAKVESAEAKSESEK